MEANISTSHLQCAGILCTNVLFKEKHKNLELCYSVSPLFLSSVIRVVLGACMYLSPSMCYIDIGRDHITQMLTAFVITHFHRNHFITHGNNVSYACV